MHSAPWRLDIRPRRLASLAAIAVIWIVCAPLIAWGVVGKQGPIFIASCPAFPLLITYYGLQSAVRGAGRISVDRDGFSVQRPGAGTARFSWRDVQRFFVGALGASPVYDGHPTVHFEVADGRGASREEWLPGNLGLPPAQLVLVMEKLRGLAQQGWPTTPGSLQELIEE